MDQLSTGTARRARVTTVWLLALGGALAWLYFPSFEGLLRRWSHDPRYAHGYLVPVFSIVLLWVRRDRLEDPAPRPDWWGLPLILGGLALRLAGAYAYFEWLETVSLLPVLAGLCVLARGRSSLRWSWPAIAFLVFMIPLPFRIEVAMASPLQRLATKCSTYALQTLGFPALAEGNVIHLNDHEIGVVEACSGLSMLFTFIAMAAGVVLVITRPWPDKVLILASAVPIALAANVTRVTVTGMLHEVAGSRIANLVFHDLAGWLMMPLALLLLWFEIGLLDRLLVNDQRAGAERSPLDYLSGTRAVAGNRDRRGGAGPAASKHAVNRP